MHMEKKEEKTGGRSKGMRVMKEKIYTYGKKEEKTGGGVRE